MASKRVQDPGTIPFSELDLTIWVLPFWGGPNVILILSEHLQPKKKASYRRITHIQCQKIIFKGFFILAVHWTTCETYKSSEVEAQSPCLSGSRMGSELLD